MTQDKQEVIGVFRGEISLDDQELLTKVAQRLGMRALFVTPDDFLVRFGLNNSKQTEVEPMLPLLPFRGLKSRYDFIVKEHFEEFRVVHASDSSPRVAGRSFNYLIDTRRGLSYKRTLNDPQPYPGLTIATRKELNLPQYRSLITNNREDRTLQLASHAIQVGSLIDQQAMIQDNFEGPKSQKFVVSLINQLALQLDL